MAITSSSLYSRTRCRAWARTAAVSPCTASANQRWEFKPPGSSSRQLKPACRDHLQAEAAHRKEVGFDNLQQVDELIGGVFHRPVQHGITLAVAQRARSGHLVSTVVIHRQRAEARSQLKASRASRVSASPSRSAKVLNWR